MELNIPQESPSEKPAPVSNAEPRFAKIPVEKLMPYPGQPRRAFRPGSIQAMAESLKINGQQTALKVMSIPEETKAQFAPCEYMILGGHRRWEGAKLAGLKTLDTVIYDLTPEEADLAAQLDNELDPLTWLDKDLAMARRIKVFNLSTREVAREKGISQSMVARAIKVAALLTSVSIDLIDQTLLKPSTEDEESESSRLTPASDYEVTRNVVLALAALEDPQKVEKALKVVIDQQMTEAQAKKLVEWLKSGHDLAEFQAQAKVRKGPRVKSPAKPEQKTSETDQSSEAIESREPENQGHQESPHPISQNPSPAEGSSQAKSALEAVADPMEAKGNPEIVQKVHKTNPTEKVPASKPLIEGQALSGSKPDQPMGAVESLFWDLLAGVSVFKQIQKKVKAGYRPSFWEGVALFFLLLAEGVSLLWKHVLKPFIHVVLGILKEIRHWVVKEFKESGKEGLKLVGRTIGGILKAVFAILFIAFIAWLVYDTVVHHGFRPLAVFEEFLDFVVQAVKLIWKVI